MAIIDALRSGDRRALARVISYIENDHPQKQQILQQLYPFTGRAYIIGITGASGSGKSSLVNRLIAIVRRCGFSVGVIAVDPTSPFSGGAILGDRVRMQDHVADKAVFIRSMGARGSLGGVARATGDAVLALDAFGKQLIFIETVGVGQSEVEIVNKADTTLVVLTPASGDGIQAMKAGLMEIADLFAINKSDLPGAEQALLDVREMLQRRDRDGGWQPPVVMTSAVKDEGLAQLWEAIERHRRYLLESSQYEERRRRRTRDYFVQLTEHLVKEQIWQKIRENDAFEVLMQQMTRREVDPYTQARALVSRICK